MNLSEKFAQVLRDLPFTGKHSDVLGLYERLQDFQFYLEARGQNHLAEQMNACCWELKMRLPIDREEQWEWTFVWMRDKVLRRLGVEAGASTFHQPAQDRSLSTRLEVQEKVERQVSEVHEFVGSRLVPSTPDHLFIGQSWSINTPLGVGYQ